MSYGTTNLRTIIRSQFSTDQLKDLKTCQENTYSQNSPKASKHETKTTWEREEICRWDDDDDDKPWYSRPKKVNMRYMIMVLGSLGIIYCVWSALDVVDDDTYVIKDTFHQ